MFEIRLRVKLDQGLPINVENKFSTGLNLVLFLERQDIEQCNDTQLLYKIVTMIYSLI